MTREFFSRGTWAKIFAWLYKGFIRSIPFVFLSFKDLLCSHIVAMFYVFLSLLSGTMWEVAKEKGSVGVNICGGAS